MTSEKMCDYLVSTGLYEKKQLDLSYAKDMIDSDKTIPISDLVKRFIGMDKYYKGNPWNIRQILANIDIIIPVEDRKDIDIISNPVYDSSESHEHDELQHYKGLEKRLKNKYGKTGTLNKVVDILEDLPYLGDTVYGIFRQTKIIPLTITGITFNEFGITLSAKNEEELGYSTINLLADNTGTEWYKTRKEAEKSIKEISASRLLNKNGNDLEH